MSNPFQYMQNWILEECRLFTEVASKKVDIADLLRNMPSMEEFVPEDIADKSSEDISEEDIDEIISGWKEEFSVSLRACGVTDTDIKSFVKKLESYPGIHTSLIRLAKDAIYIAAIRNFQETYKRSSDEVFSNLTGLWTEFTKENRGKYSASTNKSTHTKINSSVIAATKKVIKDYAGMSQEDRADEESAKSILLGSWITTFSAKYPEMDTLLEEEPVSSMIESLIDGILRQEDAMEIADKVTNAIIKQWSSTEITY